ncbi:MAG TPA: tetratricopeptide repeat-containing protein kinase family protein, partial [Blastocatellia bacterium]|nr:tetratricopeptide repeat-containing protein kinase family protein [Blastocatellia bacterium]
SNILVTAEGVPKLLDFGIAKLLSKESEGADEPPTGALMRILTPEYASPEQVKGEPVNLASDIYSLGVLLYELLTGHRPYRLKSHAPEEVMRAVCEEEPLRPSVVVASHTETIADASQGAGDPASAAATSEALRAKLRRQLSGDLDNILLKALQKEPRRRYASVAQLSDDLRRHLEGLPVSARRATFPYLAEKFVRRHKTAVAVAAAFILVSIGFTISLALQSVRVARERDRAEAVSAFLVQLFQVSNPDETKGNTITAREVLDEGAERISRELRNEPEVQARLMYTMGRVYYGVGLLEPADSLLRAALAIQRDRLGNGHLDTADTLHALAVVLARKFDYAAEPLFREALAIEREQLGAEHPRIATTLHDFGALLIAKRDYPAAEQVLQEALAMRHRLFGQKHADISDSLNWLAILYSEQGDYAKAAPLFREALAMRKELLGDDHPLVRQSMHNLACSLRDQGDYEAAEALFLQVLPERQKVWPKGHPELATTLIMLGLTILERGSPAEAEPFLREGVEMRRRMLPPQAWETAVAESDLGACLAAQERFKEAEPLLVNSFPIIKTAGGERDKRTISALKRLASLYTDWRKPHKAAFYLEELAKLNESLP